MKEYKIVSAHFELENTKKSASGFSDSMKQFFFVNHQFNPQNVELMMQKMNQDGWEVVSVAPNPAAFQSDGEVLITFEREL
ncbi:MAG: hypothetical protein IJ642_04240 [Oscillospiraceae bacterium]|nr:hypothetical protein [Oscillospiraceae bacterium]